MKSIQGLLPPLFSILAAINSYAWDYPVIFFCYLDGNGDVVTLIRCLLFWTDWAAYLFGTTCAASCQ